MLLVRKWSLGRTCNPVILWRNKDIERIKMKKKKIWNCKTTNNSWWIKRRNPVFLIILYSLALKGSKLYNQSNLFCAVLLTGQVQEWSFKYRTYLRKRKEMSKRKLWISYNKSIRKVWKSYMIKGRYFLTYQQK
jgi:hypothetical protein